MADNDDTDDKTDEVRERAGDDAGVVADSDSEQGPVLTLDGDEGENEDEDEQ